MPLDYTIFSWILLPAVCGVSQSVTKSTTLCSISSTVVLFPLSTVMLCVRPALSVGRPPLNITRLSLWTNYVPDEYSIII